MKRISIALILGLFAVGCENATKPAPVAPPVMPAHMVPPAGMNVPGTQKVEETKPADPVAEPKAEEPKAEEPKAEEPKAEEPKVEEPK